MSDPHPFAPSVLAKSVHDTLTEAQAAIPDGRNHALIVDGTYHEGHPDVRALYVQRVAGGWDVALLGEWTGRGHVDGKVALLKTW